MNLAIVFQKKIKTQKSKKILTKSVFYPIIKYVADMTKQLIAEVAELADAHGSGPCGSNTLWVRLPSSALGKRRLLSPFFCVCPVGTRSNG